MRVGSPTRGPYSTAWIAHRQGWRQGGDLRRQTRAGAACRTHGRGLCGHSCRKGLERSLGLTCMTTLERFVLLQVNPTSVNFKHSPRPGRTQDLGPRTTGLGFAGRRLWATGVLPELEGNDATRRPIRPRAAAQLGRELPGHS